MIGMNQLKKLKINTITSLMYQVVSLVSGFILPRLILQYYGSEVNGVVSSVTQFLSIISLCECGVGAVVQSALYKPLANNDISEISKIYASSNRFFRRVAYILIAYIVVLVGVFPFINDGGYDFKFTTTLIISIAIGTLAQYYLGITYQLILNAAQLVYIQMIVRSVCIIINVIASILLIINGSSIQLVKLMSSLIFLVQPLFYVVVVKRKYRIEKNIKYSDEPIKQKWNGMAQHIATVVFENTSVLVLTILSTFENVSIYGVYHLVTNGLKLFFTSLTIGMKSYLGDLFARKEFNQLNKTFDRFEWMMHTGSTFIFTVAGILIVPFVKVYTFGVDDAEYIQPVFALCMCVATAIYTIRLPYNFMIQSAGHFKQTQSSAIIEAVLNICTSIVFVKLFGLIGVGVSALVAMVYRTAYFILYLSRHILHRGISKTMKNILVDILSCIIMVTSTMWVTLTNITYLSWIVMAIKVFAICAVEVLLINLVIYRNNITGFFKRRRICDE